MKLLVIGNGGREHALGTFLKNDPRVEELFFAPGNAGTASLGINLPISASDVDGIQTWALANQPTLVVIGPEAPLCLGMADRLQVHGIPVFGPGKEGAQLEGSKIFTKEILLEAGIPTAASGRFTDVEAANAYVRQHSGPLVIKADGLASGKGVLITQNTTEALDAIHTVMVERRFGTAGDAVLIEEFLVGEEASIHAITDGTTHLLLPVSQDHKRIGEGDQGPNTGGMGAYAPAPVVDAAMLKRIDEEVFKPLLMTLQRRGIPYCGVLYGGLMLTADGPKVLEFNCRFGDPETQVLLPLLETPILDLMLAATSKRLHEIHLSVRDESAMTVVLAAPGYPDNPTLGGAIHGLETPLPPHTHLFHAGTKIENDLTVTSGGRVLAATGNAPTLQQARDRAYTLVSQINFDGMQYRRDIGHRALN